jgi:hypothetical protein
MLGELNKPAAGPKEERLGQGLRMAIRAFACRPERKALTESRKTLSCGAKEKAASSLPAAGRPPHSIKVAAQSFARLNRAKLWMAIGAFAC